jgi:hypothetical protein
MFNEEEFLLGCGNILNLRRHGKNKKESGTKKEKSSET